MLCDIDEFPYPTTSASFFVTVHSLYKCAANVYNSYARPETIGQQLPMLMLLILCVGLVLGLSAKSTLAFLKKSPHTESMQDQQPQPQGGNTPQNLNWPAIHAAFNSHVQNMGSQPPPVQPGQQPQAQVGGNPAPGGGAPFVPQPEQNGPASPMMLQAMSQANQKPGEDQGTMIIRALSDQMKRITPDVNSVHKDAQKPATGGGAY